MTTPKRLRRPDDVRAVVRAGAKAPSPVAVVHARRRGDEAPSRVTVVAGRRLGNAVARNRAKRRLRAALPQVDVEPGYDLVVLARHGALTVGYARLCEGLSGAVRRAIARTEESP